MSDNKLVKTIIDAATLTGVAAGHPLGKQKGLERRRDGQSQHQHRELRQVHRRHGRQPCA